MINFKSIELPQTPAKKHMIERMIDSGRFSEFFVDTIKGFHGKIYTFLPGLCTKERILQFDVGGLSGSRKASFSIFSKKNLVDIIQEFLLRDNESFLLLQNSMAQKGDKWLEQRLFSVLYFEKTVVHILRACDYGQVESFLKEGSCSIPSVLFLFKSTRLLFNDSAELKDADIESLIPSLEAIVIMDEYDGESYILATSDPPRRS